MKIAKLSISIKHLLPHVPRGMNVALALRCCSEVHEAGVPAAGAAQGGIRVPLGACCLLPALLGSPRALCTPTSTLLLHWDQISPCSQAPAPPTLALLQELALVYAGGSFGTGPHLLPQGKFQLCSDCQGCPCLRGTTGTGTSSGPEGGNHYLANTCNCIAGKSWQW